MPPATTTIPIPDPIMIAPTINPAAVAITVLTASIPKVTYKSDQLFKGSSDNINSAISKVATNAKPKPPRPLTAVLAVANPAVLKPPALEADLMSAAVEIIPTFILLVE